MKTHLFSRFARLRPLRFAALLVGAGAVAGLATIASAAPSLTVSPLTWDEIGLDSNNVNAGPDEYLVGARITNSGPDAATGAVASFVWDSAGPYLTLAGPASISVGTITPGSSRDVYFTVRVARNAAAYLTARQYHIQVTADGGVAASTPTPRQLRVESILSQNRNRSISVTAPAQVYIGETYDFVMQGSTATNGYEQLVHNLTLDPNVFELLSVSATYTAPPGAVNDRPYADACGWDPNPSSATYLSCIGPVRYPGGKAGGDIRAVYRVRVIGAGTASLRAVILDFSGGSYHYNSNWADVSATVTASRRADLAVTKTADPVRVSPGGTVVYTITATNLGPSPDTATVTDVLPAGVTFVSASGATCSGTTTLTCALGSLARDASVTFTITGTVAPGATGTLTNTASVAGTGTDPVAANNTASADVAVKTADLAVTKSVDDLRPASGQSVTFTVTASNLSGDTATVRVNDLLPAGLAYVSDNGAGSYVPASGVWTVGTLVAGASRNLTITATVTGAAGTSITNTAVVVGTDVAESNPANNTASVTLAVNRPPAAVDDAATTDEDVAVVVDVLANDSDPEGDSLAVDSVTQGSNGSVTTDGTSVTYTPNPGFSGVDSFTYTISDGNGGFDTATVTVTVNPVNDAPTAVDDAATTDEDTAVVVDVLANDSDPEGDSLAVDSVTQGANGSVTSDGSSVTYTPNPGFSGTDTFTYTVSDGNGGFDTATVTITVNPVNDAPVAADDAATTDEDVPVTVDVLANDSDPEGDPLSVDSVTQGANGTVTTDGSSVTYTPNPGFSGTDTFTYTISDGNGGFDTATVTITVNPVNDAPAAADDAATTDEDTAVTVDVLANDSDPEGDPLSVDSVTQGSNGTVTTDGSSVTYTPDPGFSGTDTFTYTVCDDGLPPLCDTATVTVTVNPVNDAPVAVDDAATTDEDVAVVVDVLANDSDPEGDTLSVSAVTQGANGSVTTDGSSVTYTPNPGFSGTDTFTYTISDGNGGFDTATVTVTVTAVNDAPVAADDAATTDEDTAVTVDVLANDSDPEGDGLSVSAVTQGSNGTVTTDGTSVTYTPDPGFSGTDTFTYTVSDGNGGFDTATVTITVNPVNDAPAAVDDAATTDEDTAVVVDVLANDSDPEGDSLAVDSVTQGSNGSVTTDGTSVTYTPNPGFSGTDSFTYTVSDGNGGFDTATVTITVNPVNDAPVAADDAATTDEDTAVTVDVLANDSDPEGDSLAVDSVTQGSNGTVTTDGSSVTYTPDSGFSGTDSFTYTISDGNGGFDTATVTITVNPVNDAPVAADDTATTDEEVPVVVDVLANDTDPEGDSLSVSAVTQGANGSVTTDGTSVTYTPNPGFSGTDFFTYTVSDGNGGFDTATVTITVNPVNDAPVAADDAFATNEDTTLVVVVPGVLVNDSDPDGDSLTVSLVADVSDGVLLLTADGSFSYSPATGFSGVDSFTYRVSDGNGGFDTATVTITVNPVNDAPVAADDAATTDEDVAVVVDVLANDSDPEGDTLSVSAVTQGSNGSVTTDGTSVTYTPDPGFSGTDSFTYTVCDDGTPQLCDTATVTITVDPVNDAPVAADDAATTDEDTAVTVDVLANDTDPEGDSLSVSAVTQGANGTVTTDGTSVTYTPDPGFSGTDTFTYTVCDDGLPPLCDTATVTVTVNPVNDAPVAVDDAAMTDEDVAVTVDVLSNDSDPEGDPLSVDSVTQGSNGTVTTDGTSVTYTPDPGFSGTDTFTYTVSDGNGGFDTATVTITVDPVNDVPAAADDLGTTDEDVPVTVHVLANDSDPEGDPLSVDSVTQGANGSVTTDGSSVTYTPNPGFSGTDTFTYTVCDDGLPPLCDTATVTITVNPVNDAPVAVDDAATTDEDVPVTVDVLSNDSDPDGDTVSVTAASAPAHGSATVNPGGTVTYTPNPGFSGTDSFTYTITDGNGGFDTATVTITVDPVNDAPVAGDDVAATDEDTPVTVDVLANDSDPEGDPLSVDSVTQGSNGSVSTNGSTVVYTPNPGFSGTDTFTYTISDGNGGFDTAAVTVTVNGVNDVPSAVDDAASTDEDIPVAVDVLANDSDPDGDNLTVSAVTQGSNGTVTTDGSTVSYIPSPGFSGTDTFTYTVCDDGIPPRCDTATVTVTVNGVNDAPSAVDDAAATDEDVPVTVDVLANDSDPEGDTLSVDSVTQGANGSVTTDGTSVTYTPTPGFVGTDTFTYTVSDGNGGFDTATVTVTVGAVNDAPDAVNDASITDEDTAVTVDVLANDTDPDGDNLTVSAVTQGSNGTVTTDGTTVTYTPSPGFAGTDTFTYTVCDDGIPQLCATATVTVTVIEVNSPPTAADDVATTDQDVPVTVDVLANDTDPDGDGLSVDSVTQGSNGSVTTDGTSVTYTPDPGFSGTDTFTYTVSDGNGGFDTATVTVTVDPTNGIPDATDDAAATAEGTPVMIDVLANDTDPDGDPLTVSGLGAPIHGVAAVDPGGTVTYTPNPGYSGFDVFTYLACDPFGACSTAVVVVTVSPVNDPPVAGDDVAATPASTAVVVDVLANDSDPEGDPLSVDSVTQGSNGSVVVNADGTVAYTPDPGFSGTDSFTYTVSDGNGGTATATVRVAVGSANGAPLAVADTVGTAAGSPVVVAVLANDTDPNADSLVVIAVSGAGHGVATTDGLSVTYTPNPGFSGTDSFTYTVCDDGIPSLCDTATVTVTVTAPGGGGSPLPPVNSPPDYAPGFVPVLATFTGGGLGPIPLVDPDGDPVTVTILSGSLPAGLTLGPDGGFAGTAEEAGTFDLRLELCDDRVPPACTVRVLSISVTEVPDVLPAPDLPTEAGPPDPVTIPDTLPFTGIPLAPLMLLGGGLAAFGGRLARRRSG